MNYNPSQCSQKNICLTFDVEDYFQVENLRKVFPLNTWDNQVLRIEKPTIEILDLLDEYSVHATFFVLGWIAERVPDLVKEIYNRGHEIASHGYSHQLNSNDFFSENELRDDIKKSKGILENIINESISGYRAPSFSVNDKVLSILKNLGFKYDSSYNSISWNKRCGQITGNTKKSWFLHETGIVEYTVPQQLLLGKRIPIGGGGYFRLYPLCFYLKLIERYLDDNDLIIFYLHPWEFDSKQPKYWSKLRFDYSFRHYYGLKNTGMKLNKFLNWGKQKQVGFSRIDTYMKEV